MNIYDQLLELHEQLCNDDMWLTILDDSFDELGINSIEELIDVSMENEDECKTRCSCFDEIFRILLMIIILLIFRYDS